MNFERFDSIQQELLSLIINARINLEDASNQLNSALDIWTSNEVTALLNADPPVFGENVIEQLNSHRKFAIAYLNFLESTVASGETIQELISKRFYPEQ